MKVNLFWDSLNQIFQNLNNMFSCRGKKKGKKREALTQRTKLSLLGNYNLKVNKMEKKKVVAKKTIAKVVAKPVAKKPVKAVAKKPVVKKAVVKKVAKPVIKKPVAKKK